MTPDATSLPDHRLARLAGVLYLVIIVCGIGGQALVREPLLADTPAQTVANLLAAELPFRLSILADVAMVVADVAIGVALYVLLAPVSRMLSLAAMAFRLAQAAVLGLNLLNLVRAIDLANASLFEVAQRDALVRSHLDAHAAGYDLGLFFFAVNCALVGVLLWRSGFVPRILGAGVAVTGGVYAVGSTLRIIAPALAGSFAAAYVVPVIVELSLCLWLLSRRATGSTSAEPSTHPTRPLVSSPVNAR